MDAKDGVTYNASASFLQRNLREYITVLNVEIVAIQILDFNCIEQCKFYQEYNCNNFFILTKRLQVTHT